MTRRLVDWLERDRYGVALVVLGIALGLVIGLALGWLVWPVEWDTSGLVVVDGRIYVTITADLFAFDRNDTRAQTALAADGAQAALCRAIYLETDSAARARLAILAVVSGVDCNE